MKCDFCGRSIPKGHNVWLLDRGKTLNGSQIERRGGRDVFCGFSCLADRVEGEGRGGRRRKASTGARRKRA